MMQFKTFIRFSVIILCLLLGNFIHAATKAHEQSLDRIIAIVNDTVITQSELDHAITTVKNQFASNPNSLPSEDVLRKQVLDQLVTRKLQLQIAEQANVRASDEDVNKTIARIANQNNLSVTELYQQLAKQGVSKDDYHKELREELTMQKIQQQEVGSKITITPQEVDDFATSSAWKTANNKEYHLKDILIALPEAPTTQDIEQAKKRADSIMTKLHNGLSFNQIAIAESSSNKALQGGDLGWRKLPEIPSAFASQLTNMKENGLIGPILTSNGYHIVLLAGIRTGAMHGSAVEQHKQIQEQIFQRKFEEELQNWLTKLRSAAFINLHPDA